MKITSYFFRLETFVLRKRCTSNFFPFVSILQTVCFNYIASSIAYNGHVRFADFYKVNLLIYPIEVFPCEFPLQAFKVTPLYFGLSDIFAHICSRA